MSELLAYIGKAPMDEAILEKIKGYKNIIYKKGEDFYNCDKINTNFENDISLLIARKDSSLLASESYIVSAQNGLTNQYNISLPFNLFRKPQGIDDIALAIIEYVKATNKSETIKALSNRLLGDLSCVFYDKNESSLYCIAGSTPMIIGLSDNYSLVSNSIEALSSLTNKFIILKENEKAKITPDKITIYNNKNHKIKKPVQKLTQDLSCSNDYYLIEQLFNLSSNLSTCLSSLIKDDKLNFSSLKLTKMNVKAINKIVIVCDCESLYATLCASKLFNVLCNLPIEVHLADEYQRQSKALDTQTLFIVAGGGSFSTPLYICTNYARHCKCKIISILPENLSLLNHCDYIIKTPKSTTDSVYNISLNGFIYTYLPLTMLSIYLGNLLGTVSNVYMDVAIKMAQMLGSKLAQSVKQTHLSELYKGLIERHKNIIFTGCGIDYALASQINSIFPTITKKISLCVSSFELNNCHIDKDTLIIGIITNKDYLFEFKSNLERAKLNKASVLIVSNCNIEEDLNNLGHIVSIQDSLPIYNPLPTLAYLYSLTIHCENNTSQDEKSVAI